MLAGLVVATASGLQAAPAETVVRVYPTAVVAADQVTLGDVAALSGDSARIAGTWAVTESPAFGRELTLDQTAIEQLLVRRGVNPSNWVFRGSSRCRITRPAPAAARETASARSEAREVIREMRGRPATMPAATTRPAGIDADTLEGAIHQHIAARLAGMGGRPVIQLNPAQRGLLRLSRPAYDFRITDRGDRQLGLVPLEIAIFRDGRPDQVQSVLVEVMLVKPVILAAGTINRGQTIRAEDITVREQSFDRADRIGLSDTAAVIGQRATRFLNKDEMLTGKDIEPLPLILRNDLVTVTARRGSVTITMAAKALAAAGYGQAVELRNEASKQTFTAVVTGPKSAELVPGAAEAADAVSLAGGRK
jgi:flagella basal body P-ring formation protein FlgA